MFMNSKNSNYDKYLKYKNKYLNLKKNKNLNLIGGADGDVIMPFIDIILDDPDIKNNEDFIFFSRAIEREKANFDKADQIFMNIIGPNATILNCINDLTNIQNKYVEPETEQLQKTRNKHFAVIRPRDIKRVVNDLNANINRLKRSMMDSSNIPILQSIEDNGGKFIFTENNFTVGSYYDRGMYEITINDKPGDTIKALMREYCNYIKNTNKNDSFLKKHQFIQQICPHIYPFMERYSPHMLIYYENEGSERKYIGSVLYCINPIAKCVFFISIYKSFLNKCDTCTEYKFSKRIIDQLTFIAMMNECTVIATSCVIGIMGNLLEQNGFIRPTITNDITKFRMTEKHLDVTSDPI